MMNWLYYLLEANLYLAVFYGFYYLLLHKETFYKLNRHYLIAVTVAAFALPFLQVGLLSSLNVHNRADFILADPKLTALGNENSFYAANNLIVNCYILVAAIFVLQLFYSFYSIIIRIVSGKKQKDGKIVYVELTTNDTAFSFFNYLFINPSIEQKDTILKHELVHIHQKHSVDVLFFEIIKILNWFNPICWLIKKDIKLLHEYLADDHTTSKISKHEYAVFLIQNSFGATPSRLSNQIFNPSILKKRIMMLNKEKSQQSAKFRLVLLLPIVAIMLCASTLAFTKDYAVFDLYPAKSSPAKPEPEKKKKADDTKKQFYIDQQYNSSTKKVDILEKRLILVNGKELEKSQLGLIENYDGMVMLKSAEATDKYGKKGINGALEFTGNRIQTFNVPPPPAPPGLPVIAKAKKKQMKVVPPPPPVVKKDEL